VPWHPRTHRHFPSLLTVAAIDYGPVDDNPASRVAGAHDTAETADAERSTDRGVRKQNTQRLAGSSYSTVWRSGRARNPQIVRPAYGVADADYQGKQRYRKKIKVDGLQLLGAARGSEGSRSAGRICTKVDTSLQE
jgi:hypothetical protein